MDRARAAAAAALFALMLAATVVLATAAPTFRETALEPAADVGWPPSTLVVSEIQTGGASASDEFAEIANMGSAPVDLSGLEVVYVTSTGGTVTRKAAWSTSLLLEPGRHLLLANSLGAFASIADVTYSGGFAATGGAIAIRAIGGAPIDAVGWGDATSTFVEGTVAPAPAAGTSLERRPGGMAGNTTDTNDNAADTFLQAVPNPQNLAAPPVPAPGPSATPTPAATPTLAPSATPSPSPAPTATPGPSASVDPSAAPSDSPSPAPTATTTPDPSPTVSPAPTATASPEPTPSAAPTATPSPTATAQPTGTPGPTPSPTSTPGPSPSPEPTTVPTITIAEARALPDDAPATIVGTLTTDLGALESGRVGFIEDATAGLALYLDAAVDVPLAAGTVVRVFGTLDERYGARTLRVAVTDITDLGPGTVSAPAGVETGAVDEAVEGRRVVVSGLTVGSPTSFADGLGILVDDGSGPVRVVVGLDALGSAMLPAGTLVRAIGPVGQRDSTGTGTSGYRVHATEPGELEVMAPPPTPTPPPTASPSPTAPPTPTPSSTPNPTPAPSATPGPGPSPTPAPTPGALTIAEARSRPAGSVVTVTGVVTAESGRLGTPSLIAIADATGGIVVRVPEGLAAPGRGRQVTVTGPTSAPYGQLEVRPPSSGFRSVGSVSLPGPLEVTAAGLGEGSEGRLATIVGTVSSPPRKATSGDLTIDLVDAGGTAFRAMADASSQIAPADLVKGATYRLTGLVGQRASAKGALDGYRVWVRDRADIVLVGGGSAGSSPAPGGSPAATVLTIAAARLLDDAPAVVEGVITAGAGLLDDDGRRIVIQDATGGLEVYLPADTRAPALGTRIRVAGTIGRAWDAPRLRATSLTVVAAGGDVSPAALGGAPGESLEWQLVRIAGTLTDVTRLGDRWRADVRVGGVSVLVTGLAGAGIASTSLLEGRAVTITGIVRRPYPTATDRRWTVIPRGPWDVAIGPASSASGGGTGGSGSGSGGPGSGAGDRSPSPASAFEAVTLIDLATLEDHLGATVRVGGLVVARTADGFTLDDGTAVGRIQLAGETADFLDLIGAGDALGIVGRVARGPAGDALIVATDPGGLVRLGSLGEIVPLAAGTTARPTPSPSAGTTSVAGLGSPLGPVEGSWVGLVGLLLASGISLSVTLVRRRRAHQRLAAVVRERLSELRRPFGRA